MKVLVTGGRTFQDRDWLWAGLDMLHGMQAITEIIEGGAPGADVRAQEWARYRGINCVTVEADWEKYSRGLKQGQKNPAGVIRNTEMAKLKPDVVLACPGSNGTANMIATAKAHGLRIVLLEKMPVVRT